MPVSSRRGGTISLSFDMLEERSLLSHFSMPMVSAWSFPGGHLGGPPPAFSGPPRHPSEPPGDGAGFPFQGRSIEPSASTSQAAPAVAIAPTSNSVTPSSPLVQALAPRAGPPDQGQGGQQGEDSIAEALAASSAPAVPLAVSPPASKSLDTTSGTISVGISGLARLVPVTVGLIVPDVLFTPAWTSQSGRLFRELEKARSAGASVDTNGPNDSGRSARSDLPGPRGAGLITDFTAFRSTPIGDCLKGLFGGLSTSDEPVTQQTHNVSYLLPVALAAAALEAVRRWRRSSTKASNRSRQSRNSLLIGFSRTSR
jgi:hypothetical protein